VTIGPGVPGLRVALWAEHLRAPLADPRVHAALADLDLALGASRAEWLPPRTSVGT
jgi:hypothetical protein